MSLSAITNINIQPGLAWVLTVVIVSGSILTYALVDRITHCICYAVKCKYGR